MQQLDSPDLKRIRLRARTDPKRGPRAQVRPHLVSWRGGRRLSTMTGFGGGWNAPAPGWEGPVLCSRAGPARAPAGTDSRGQDCAGGPELPGNPATSPSSRSSEGPPPRSPETSRLAYRQPGPAPFVRPALEPRPTYSRRQTPAQAAAPWGLQRSGSGRSLLHGSLQGRPPCLRARVETTTPRIQCDGTAAYRRPMAAAMRQNSRFCFLCFFSPQPFHPAWVFWGKSIFL